MADIFKIKFIDIDAREKAAHQTLLFDIANLRARREKNKELSTADLAELRRLKRVRDAAKPANKYFDPLFVATRAALGSDTSPLRQIAFEHTDGVLEFPNAADDEERNKATTRVALIFGLLQLSKAPVAPLVVDARGNIVPDPSHPNAALFIEALFPAVGRADSRPGLPRKILEMMAEAVSPNGNGDAAVSSREFAQVFTKLVENGIDAKDPNLNRHVVERLDQVQEIGEARPLHEFEINLPDLEATTDFVIEADHCKLFGSFIFASAFEELRAFQVVDRLVEMSQRGELPLIRGKAGTQLYNYWREAPNRMREDERQTFYAMTLGLPTGQPGVAVNVEFQDLWLRFVSSVSSLVRESRVDQLLRSTIPASINQQQVKKAARDLALNMSSRGYGMVFYAAADLQKQINEIIDLLGDEELRSAFGARDMWGVIDQIAQTELGGARNSSKYRMLATSGAIVTSWMAKNVGRMLDPTMPMVDLNAVQNPPSRLRGQTAVSHPTDYDLVNACEMWLADSAMGEDRIEMMSQPRESPAQTSRPIQIPSVARDLLEGAGLGLGMGMAAGGRGRSNGHATGHSNGRGSRYQGY
jgi:hypothetical protein